MENNIPPALPPKAKWSALAFSRPVESPSESINDSLSVSTDSSQNVEEAENRQKLSKPIPAPRRLRRQPLDSNRHPCTSDITTGQEKHVIGNVANPLNFSPTRIHENGSCENSPKDSDAQSNRSSFSDTDSIQFLEHHRPSLIKSFSFKDRPKWKWWNDSANKSSFLEKVKEALGDTSLDCSGEHIYEPYDYQENFNKKQLRSYEEVLELPQQKRDIFDLVSFKSPLYGTSLKPSKSSDTATEIAECENFVENSVQSLEYSLPEGTAVQSMDYDYPSNSDIQEKQAGFQQVDELNAIYDMPIPEFPPPAHPPPPLPFAILTEISGMMELPPPLLPPRPVLAHPILSEEAPAIPSRSPPNSGSKPCSEASFDTPASKPLMPVRPAPPVPRDSLISDVPPPLPGKISLLSRTASLNSKKLTIKCERNCREDKLNSTPCCSVSRSNSSGSTPCASVNKESRRSKHYHSGYLFKTGSNRKEFLQRWCVLDDKRFSYYINEKENTFRDSIDANDMVALSISSQEKHSCTSCQLELCCFELSTVKEEGRQFLFGARLPSERQEWMKYLCLAMALPQCRLKEWAVDFSHAGYLRLKEGTAGHWQLAWMVLKKRNLLVIQLELKTTEVIDLRKSIGVAKFASNSNQGCAAVSVSGPIFHIDMPQKSLYLQADWPAHTESWYRAIHKAWTLPADPYLKDHYLTQENVPVIIDKCVNFVSTYGTTVQGIYRLAGSASKVRRLLELLRQNVWTVHIKPDEYSVHDVTSVLKRFVRELPECMVSEKLYQLWVRASEIDNQEERLTTYKDLLHQLPEENYQALKKLVGHLFSISEHEDKNKMPSMNLAPIFGPTLLFSISTDFHGYNQTNAVMDVIADLITHYTWLFEVDPKEVEKEKKIQQALQLLREAKVAQRPAGDILVGVYIYSKEWGKCLNVRLTPTMTAEDLCLYAFSHADIKESCDKLAVFEIICNEELERPLHYQEIVLAVTLRWASWAEADAKGNYLLVKHNYICDAIMPLIQTRQPLSMFSELKYADSHTKTFKKILFEFIGAKLTCYKDARATNPLGQWNIEDITWYTGTEMKRSAPTRWGFTFIERNKPIKRTKENPYFGKAVCCNTEEEFHKWLAAMLIGEHPNSLLPQRRVPDLLS